VSRTIFRSVIVVDDGWQTLSLTGPILHIGTRQEDAIEIWHIHDDEAATAERAFIVVGTGRRLAPALASYVGTAITPSGRYVWHLFEHERLTAGSDG